MVSVANGNIAPIIREGVVSLSYTFNLDTMFVVPYLDYNLLFVVQITAPYIVLYFLPSFFVFKDIQTCKMIGYGIRKWRLYYLELI